MTADPGCSCTPKNQYRLTRNKLNLTGAEMLQLFYFKITGRAFMQTMNNETGDNIPENKNYVVAGKEYEVVEHLVCKECGKKSRTKGGISMHLRSMHGYDDSQIAEFKKSVEHLRTRSGIDCLKKQKESIKKKYGTEFFFQRVDLCREACMKKLGVDSPAKHPDVLAKMKKTCLEKYGAEFTLGSEEVKRRIKETCIEKYGGPKPMCSKDMRERHKNTMFERYGGWHSQTEDFRIKNRETSLRKFGEESYSHTDEFIQSKTRYKYKEYIFPSGKTVKMQGYEHLALDYLIKTYNESDIVADNREITSTIGKIWYMFNDSKHRYFPDIYIKSINTVIEVKSEYTFSKFTEVNSAKRQACIDAGFNFAYIVFNTCHKLVRSDLPEIPCINSSIPGESQL
jgi:hypothetical protein